MGYTVWALLGAMLDGPAHLASRLPGAAEYALSAHAGDASIYVAIGGVLERIHSLSTAERSEAHGLDCRPIAGTAGP